MSNSSSPISEGHTKQLIAVTGAAGYVGLNTCYKLLQAGYDIVTVDDYSTGRKDGLNQLQKLQEELHLPGKIVMMVKMDISENKNKLRNLFKDTRPDTVIHLAAKIVVEQSDKEKTMYYRNNIIGTENVIRAMKMANVKNCIFSSTAAVYGGQPKNGLSFQEDDVVDKNMASNYYALTKMYDEDSLREWQEKYSANLIINRFFNLAGAGGPNKEFGYNVWPPTHLMPSAIAAAMGLLSGFEYKCPMGLKTRDGSTIRDYVHVEDIADALVTEVGYLGKRNGVGASEIINLGSGEGQTTKEIVGSAAELISGDFPMTKGKVRPNESPSLVANITKANALLGWNPKHSLTDMIMDLQIWFGGETFKDL